MAQITFLKTPLWLQKGKGLEGGEGEDLEVMATGVVAMEMEEVA